MSFIGTSAFGLRMPIIKEGDDVVDIITSSLGEAYDKGEYKPKENDIIYKRRCRISSKAIS